MKTKFNVVWFAKGGGIARCGPFKSQVDAVKAMTLAKDKVENDAFPYPQDLFVWPEKATKENSNDY